MDACRYVIRTAIAVVALGFAAADAAPTISTVHPLRERIDAPKTTTIAVTFAEDIDSTTVTPASFRVFGRWSGPAAGTFIIDANTVTFTPLSSFFAGERVMVVLSTAIKDTNGVPMSKGYSWYFWIRTEPATLDLTYVTRITSRLETETWVQPYGAYAGDLNNDGWSDLLVPCEQPGDARVFLNDSTGGYQAFTIASLPGARAPSPSEGGDFNMDGEIDVAVGNGTNNVVDVLLGDGTGGFPGTTSYLSGSFIRGVGVLDLNGDGCDDLVTANRVTDNISTLLNDGDGTFGPAISMETGGNGEYGIATGDANNDGLIDVFVGEFESPYSVVVLLSDGAGGFVARPPVLTGGRPWQITSGDFNGDGNVDAATANAWNSAMAVLLGDGMGGFSSVRTYHTGAYPISIDAGDLDGDGDLELVTSNGDGNWTIYENRPGGFVNPRTLLSSSSGSCAILHDRDNDGDLDLTGIDETDDWIYLYENHLTPTTVRPATSPAVVLFQNQPNPFNPSTTIRFDVMRAAEVELSIYDTHGGFVVNLIRGHFDVGSQTAPWNGRDARGVAQASGVYFYRLTAGGASESKRMVLLK